MSDLQQFKTQIFTGINDQPISATAEAASNASDTIDKINGLIDALDTWGDAELYLDLTSGDDAKDGLTQETALYSPAALVNLIATKTIDRQLTIKMVGTALPDAVFDLQNVKAIRGAKLIFTNGNNPAIISRNSASPAQPIINIPSELTIELGSIVFKAESTIVFDAPNQIDFQNTNLLCRGEFVQVHY